MRGDCCISSTQEFKFSETVETADSSSPFYAGTRFSRATKLVQVVIHCSPVILESIFEDVPLNCHSMKSSHDSENYTSSARTLSLCRDSLTRSPEQIADGGCQWICRVMMRPSQSQQDKTLASTKSRNARLQLSARPA